MNAGAPQSALPDWSADSSALTTHVEDYWASMGVEICQITQASISGSVSGGGSTEGGPTSWMAGPNTVVLARGVDGVPVVESLANARFDADDQTTSEGLYWPEVPADVVTAAIAFKNQLADPNALGAYKAKLPPDAQGQGGVVIHHSSEASTGPFQAAATYQVIQTSPLGDGGDLNFDPSGNPVTTLW